MPLIRTDVKLTNPDTAETTQFFAGDQLPAWAASVIGGADPAAAVIPPPDESTDIAAWRQHADLLGITYTEETTKEQLITATT